MPAPAPPLCNEENPPRPLFQPQPFCVNLWFSHILHKPLQIPPQFPLLHLLGWSYKQYGEHLRTNLSHFSQVWLLIKFYSASHYPIIHNTETVRVLVPGKFGKRCYLANWSLSDTHLRPINIRQNIAFK